MAILGYSVYRLSPTTIRYPYDAATGILYRTLMDLCGPHFRPTAVAFAYPRPRDIDFYRHYFGCRLIFDAKLTGITFHKSWLDRPLTQASPEVLRNFVNLIAREEAEQETAFARRVERAIQQTLLGGTATAPAVAAILGVSERSMRRKLDDEGESFRVLLGQRRCALAKQLLRNTSLPVAEVAAAVQYRDANAFSRAFREWVDLPPTQWRSCAHNP